LVQSFACLVARAHKAKWWRKLADEPPVLQL
jgi:hypothetical protein